MSTPIRSTSPRSATTTNRECVEKYIEDTGCKLCQTTVLGTINHMIDDNAIVCAAAGSLPGDMQGLWRARKENTYHMEYGYSCMGYEVASALGAKIACPDQEFTLCAATVPSIAAL